MNHHWTDRWVTSCPDPRPSAAGSSGEPAARAAGSRTRTDGCDTRTEMAHARPEVRRSSGRGLAATLIACLSCTPTTTAEPRVEQGPTVPTSDARPEPPRAEPNPAREPERTVEVARTPALPRSLHPWIWHHSTPEAVLRRFPFWGLASTSYDLQRKPPRRYTAEPTEGAIVLARDDLVDTKGSAVKDRVWTAKLRGTPTSDSVVLHSIRGEQILVAFCTHGGYRLMDFTAEGEDGIGPIDVLGPPGMEGPRGLQLSTLTDGTILVRVRGPDWAYQDELGPFDFDHRARTTFDATILAETFDWPPQAVAGQRFGHRWATDAGTYEVVRRGAHVHLVSRDATGKHRWDAKVIEGSGKSWTSAAVLEHDPWVVAVIHDHRRTGSTSYAIDRESGEVIWLGSAGALSSERRSGHRTEVAALVDDKGQLVVYGREVDGDYRGVQRFVQYSSISSEGVGYELRRR